MGAAELLRDHRLPVIAGTYKQQIVRPDLAGLVDKEGFQAREHLGRTRITDPMLGPAARQSLGGRKQRQRMDRRVQMGEAHHGSMSSNGRTGPGATAPA